MTVSSLDAKRHRNAIAVLKEAARQARASERLMSSAFLYAINPDELVAVGTRSGIHNLTKPEDSGWTLVAKRLPTKKEWEASDGCFFVVWPGLIRVRAAFYDLERKVFVGLGGVVPATRWRPVVLPLAPEI